MMTFHILTISNDLDQYAAMRASFLAAGFDDARCRFSLLDNSRANAHEPYEAINAALADAAEPYLIFCHQDVRADLGHGFDQLTGVLGELTRADPRWAVAGNAGGTTNRLFYHLVDPNGDHRAGPLPQRVFSLDENFMVVRGDAGVRCSTSLASFHFYGVDLCLNAMLAGRSAYVVDFRLTHLSRGDSDGADFQRRLGEVQARWSPSFPLCIIKTACCDLPLSRFAPVRAALRNPRLRRWVIRAMPKSMRVEAIAERLARGMAVPVDR